MTTKADKQFDCVEFKQKAQARIYEAIKDLSPAQEIAYFQKAAEEGPLGGWWKAAHQRTTIRPAERGTPAD